jgi:hypothetical protein
MEWQNWLSAIGLMLAFPGVFVVAGYYMLRTSEDAVFRVSGGGILLLGLVILVLPLILPVSDKAPIFQDDPNHERQPESRDSLLQQREYLEARLWEMKTERQAP